MIDGKVLLIALMALCGADLALIWQVSRLTDRVHDVQEDMLDVRVTHARPDSWERIAYDIETVVPIDDEDDERFRRELADRIRRLAAREDKRCED